MSKERETDCVFDFWLGVSCLGLISRLGGQTLFIHLTHISPNSFRPPPEIMLCGYSVRLSKVSRSDIKNKLWLTCKIIFLHYTGYLYRGRANGPEREENEGYQWGLQEIQRKRVIQKERRHTWRALPLRSTFFFVILVSQYYRVKKWIKIKFVCSTFRLSFMS